MDRLSLRKIASLILFTLLFFCNLFSQEEPDIKFGTYSIDEFRFNNSEADTNVSAIVLFDFGEAYFTRYLEVEYSRHVRVKILKKSGFHWGNCKIYYNTGKLKESVKDIEGYTAYLDQNNNIIKEEIDSDNILDEEITKNKSAKSFILPSMQPGCIIEYRYKIKSEYFYNFPKEWKFQYEDPVLWSEYRTEIPNIYKFAIVKQRNDLLHIDTQKEFSRSYSNKETENRSTYLNGIRKRIVMRNVPPLYKGPYMKSVEDYRAKVIYQLASYNSLDSSSGKFISSWEELGSTLMETNDFGERLDGTSLTKKIVKELTDTIPGKDQMLISIYNFVKDTITWNKHNNIYAAGLDDILESKKGDAGDINLLLAAMLKSAGIESYPVIISTRENGTIYTGYPLLNQFNRVLVYANTGKKEFILDATDKSRPYYLLPEDALNDNGLMILPDKVEWVKISPAGIDLSLKVASVLVKNDGSIEGIIRITKEEYAALSERHNIENLNNNLILKKVLQTDKTGIKDSLAKIINRTEAEKPIIIESRISSNTYSQITDKLIYFNPHFLGRIEENPFKSDERYFSVNYTSPIEYYFKVNITLPSGYHIKEYPKPVSIKVGNKNAGYTREVTINGNLVQYSTHFYISKITFPPEEYYELKEFYDRLVVLESEQFILQKQN